MTSSASKQVHPCPCSWHHWQPRVGHDDEVLQRETLYDFIGKREKAIERVSHILDTEYNDTPGGLSGNDAGQMSAWYIFSSIGFYPVCPATDRYMLSTPRFQRITINPDGGRPFVITLNSFPQDCHFITHSEIIGH